MTLDEALAKIIQSKKTFLSPFTFYLNSSDVTSFVALKQNPDRFTKEFFAGDWADDTRFPTEGNAKMISKLKLELGTTLLIIRQKNSLFATEVRFE